MKAERKSKSQPNRGKSTTNKVSDSKIKRKQAEALRDSEELHRIILSSISDAVFITNDAGKFIYIGLNVNVIFGYSQAEVAILGNIEKLLGAEMFDATELGTKGEIQNIERQIISKTGIPHILLVSVKRVSIDGGTVLYTCRDITERKQAEEALQEAELKYRMLVERLPVAVYTSELGVNGKWHYVSPQIEHLLGFTAEEWIADPELWYRHVHPDDRDRQEELEEQAWARHESFEGEYRISTRDGNQIWIRDSAQILPPQNNGAPLVQGVLMDITERKHAEEALSLSKAQLLANLDNTPNVAIQWYDKDGNILYWNPASEFMYGWKSMDAIGKTLGQLIHTPEEQAEFMRILVEVRETGKPFGPYEAQVRRRDGTTGWVLATTFSIPMNDEQIGFVCMDVDITERKSAEKSLRESEERFKSLSQAAFEGILIHDQGVILDANQKMADLFGIQSPDELIGKNGIVILPMTEKSRKYLRSSMEKNSESVGEIEVIRRNGSTFPAETQGSDIIFMGRKARVVAMRDITERKQAQQMQAALYEIANVAQTTLSLNDLFTSIHKTLGTFMPAENFYIAIYDAQNDLLAFPYFVDQFEEAPLPQKPGNGLTEYVLRTRQPLLATPQVFEGMINSRQVDSVGIDSVDWIGVPLTVGDETFGVMVIQTYTDKIRLTQKDLALMTFVSAQAAMVIKRKQAEESLHQRTSQLEALREIGLELTAELDVDKLLHSITAHALDLLHSTGGGIYLYRPEQKKLEWVVAIGTEVAPLGTWLEYGDGLSGKVWEQRKPIIVDDYEHWEGRAAQYEGKPFRAVMGVPIIKGDEFLGVLVLLADLPGSFNLQDASLLELFAGYAAGAIHSAHLFEETRRRAEEFAGLYQTTRDLSIQQDLSTVLTIITQQATTLLNVPNASITLYDSTRADLELVASIGPDLPIGTRRKVGDGLAGRVAQSRAPIIIEDYQHWEYRSSLFDAIPYAAMIGVPLLYGGSLLGVLDVSDVAPSRRTFSEADVRLLSLFAGQAASAIANARLFEETVRRLENLQSLRVIDNAISGGTDVHAILEVILGQVISQLGADAAVILLFEPAKQFLKYAAGRGFRTQALQYTGLSLGRGYAGKVALERKTKHIPDIRAVHTDFLRSPTIAQEGFISYYGVPLIAKGEIKGVLEVFHRAPFEAESEWLDFLETLAGQTAIAIDNTALHEGLQLSNIELTLAYEATIEGWSRALDLRDKETEGHTQRVTEITLNLAKAIGVSEDELVNIRRGALLHDIGKMGVPDSILLKPGELTKEEWEIMRRHPIYADEMLAPIAYLKAALDIPYCHHEKWDGTGYPNGLKGEDIPLAARIFAVVDVWDAIRSDRPYRKGWDAEKAIEYIKSQSGTHFDPSIVKAFLVLFSDE